VHRLPRSLLVAREPRLGEGEQIVLAVDGSGDAPGLVEIAIRAARRLGRGIVVVHAVGAEPHSERHHFDAQRGRLTEGLGTPPDVVVEPEHAAELVIRVALERKSSLIVMGSRRVGGLRALGSVSERVAHRAHCSVLVVRPEEQG
jgi:nucleotide-binding universal stress UspA family protein